ARITVFGLDSEFLRQGHDTLLYGRMICHHTSCEFADLLVLGFRKSNFGVIDIDLISRQNNTHNLSILRTVCCERFTIADYTKSEKRGNSHDHPFGFKSWQEILLN